MATALVKHCDGKSVTQLAKYLANPTQGKKGITAQLKEVWVEGLRSMWRKPEDWPAIEASYSARSEAVKSIIQVIEKEFKTVLEKRTDFEECDRDEIAGRDPAVLGHLPDDVIYLAVDRRKIAMAFQWPDFMEHFFGAGFLAKVKSDMGNYSFCEPPSMPDKKRHVTDPIWITQEPRFDHQQYTAKDSKNHPEAVHGVYHWGFGGENGHGPTRMAIKEDSRKPDPDTRRLLTEMAQGSQSCITEAFKFVGEILDPELMQRQVAAIKKFRGMATMTIPEGAFSCTAGLVNVKTETHFDSTDLAGGLAWLGPFGDFTGEYF